MAIATNLGYPRFGRQHQLKWALEKYWRGTQDEAALQRTAHDLRQTQQHLQQQLGVQHIPANDFSLYDHVLDTIALVGAVPPRYGWRGGTVNLAAYFAMARGGPGQARATNGGAAPARQ